MARQPSGRSVLKKAISQLKRAETAEELRQLQAVIFPLEHGFSLAQTATVLGVSPSWVNKIRNQFIQSGGKLTTKTRRGGRRREKLSPDEETSFLTPFLVAAQSGGELVVKDVKVALEERLGWEISLTTVYNLLHRHGWNKVVTGSVSSRDNIGNEEEKTADIRTEARGSSRNPVRFTWGYNPYAKQVNILNIDSKFPNYAMAKVEKYFTGKGFTINSDPNLTGKMPSFISVIFESNRDKAQRYEGIPDTIIGGSGWDIKSKLPAEIEAVRPRINLGYTSRGCNRSCPFCIVPQKEGKASPEADLFDIWDGTARRVTLLDNNILQLPAHFRLICTQAQKTGIVLDWNQGLDVRLVTDDVAKLLETTRIADIRFALDSVDLIPIFQEKLELLRRYKVRKAPLVYLLTGYDSSWEEDMVRVNFLVEQGCRPYVMLHENVKAEQQYKIMAEWVNQFWPVKSMGFEEFKRLRRDRPDKRNRGTTPLHIEVL